jgi:hypothetical protein
MSRSRLPIRRRPGCLWPGIALMLLAGFPPNARGGPSFEVLHDACDSNDDGDVDISDAIATLGVLFLGGGVIPLPGTTDCGVDPTVDQVGCDAYDRCP